MIFKITTETAWREAQKMGQFEGSDDDRRDGYIHLSAAHQIAGTAAKYFRHQPDLLLIAFDEATLGAALTWEPSRGGDQFPHLYAPLPAAAAVWSRRLPIGTDGVPVIPEEISAW